MKPPPISTGGVRAAAGAPARGRALGADRHRLCSSPRQGECCWFALRQMNGFHCLTNTHENASQRGFGRRADTCQLWFITGEKQPALRRRMTCARRCACLFSEECVATADQANSRGCGIAERFVSSPGSLRRASHCVQTAGHCLGPGRGTAWGCDEQKPLCATPVAAARLSSPPSPRCRHCPHWELAEPRAGERTGIGAGEQRDPPVTLTRGRSSPTGGQKPLFKDVPLATFPVLKPEASTEATRVQVALVWFLRALPSVHRRGSSAPHGRQLNTQHLSQGVLAMPGAGMAFGLGIALPLAQGN